MPWNCALTATIEINAPPDVVWKVLTDFPRYSSWNPFIKQLGGELIEGRCLKVFARLPCGLPMVLWPRVLEVVAERKIKWRGHLFLPGLLDGEHLFTLEPIGKRGTRFTQAEGYSGVLLPFVWTWLREQGYAAFAMMNSALKLTVEHVYGNPCRL